MKIAIVGLGYVGLPLAVAFAKKNYGVIAFDIKKNRIQELESGIDHTHEVVSEELSNSNLSFTHDENDLKKANIFIVTVPTPINDTNRPDLNLIYKATALVGKYVKKGDIVIYESTVYPGVTEDECVPILEKISGLTYIKDFGVGYSPERINPGDKQHRLETIVKVVAGSDAKTLETVQALYASIVDAGTFPCANIKTAEAAKVIENIQRDLNIALVNELSLIFHRLNIDTQDVLDAASTKWNFARFEPGLVGGHCIGVDPYYLTHCAEMQNYNPEVILSGRRINNRMGEFVASETIKGILSMVSHLQFPLTVTILGFTFKENVPDVRNTKVIDVVNALRSYNVNVQVHDPYADSHEVQEEYGLELMPFEKLTPADGVIFAVKHSEFLEKGWNFIESLLKNRYGFVVDLKNSLDREKRPEKIELWRL